jgi:hypothetical protein
MISSYKDSLLIYKIINKIQEVLSHLVCKIVLTHKNIIQDKLLYKIRKSKIIRNRMIK